MGMNAMLLNGIQHALLTPYFCQNTTKAVTFENRSTRVSVRICWIQCSFIARPLQADIELFRFLALPLVRNEALPGRKRL